MPWKIIYALSIMFPILGIILYVLSNSPEQLLLSIFIGIIRFLPCLLFIGELDSAIKNYKVRTSLQVFEFISYASIVLLLIGLIPGFQLLEKILEEQGSIEYVVALLLMLKIMSEIICVVVLVLAYVKRMSIFGGYSTHKEKELNHANYHIRARTRDFYETEDRVKLCQECSNKKFDAKTGILCNLTDAKPNFLKFCESFDQKERS